MNTATIQFNLASDLGTYRASNNYSIPLTVSDSDPAAGPVTYSLTTGTLPLSLTLDSVTGYVYGYLEYENDNLNTYSFSVTATKTFQDLSTTSTSTTFSITAKGFIDTNVVWQSDSDLGSIYLGYDSELKIIAADTINQFEVKYEFLNGDLPPGLTLLSDGAIAGTVSYGSTGTFSFTASAQTVYDSTGTLKTFTLRTENYDNTEYTKIYVKPFLERNKRKDYQLFINNPNTFKQNLIYRYFDSNFGVQSEMKMVLNFGLERQLLDQYTQALRQNFYKRRFTLGKVKTAVAKDDSGTVLYELIYLDVVDNLRNVAENLYTNRIVSPSYSGGSAGQILYDDVEVEIQSIYHPASIKNMRERMKRIQLDDFSTIKVNKFLEPLFMQTAQSADAVATYLPVVPLCYANPGKSKQIIKNIAATGFKFNMIDFEIDRIVVQNSLDNASAKYLLFGRNSISDNLDTDQTLYQGDVLWQFEDGPQLTRTS